MQRLPHLAVGDVLVVLVAGVTAAYHLVLFFLWPETRDRLWAAVIALGTGLYAAAGAALYATTDPAMAPLNQRLMLVGGNIICHTVPLYMAALEDRSLGRERWVLAASFLVWTALLLFTPWVFADEVHPLSLGWLDGPYLQPAAGPLNELCYLALLAVAGRPIARDLWRWNDLPIRLKLVSLTMLLWLFFAAYDGMVGLGWLPTGPAFFLEYGLLFLSLFLFGDSVTEHARLLHKAVEERSAAEAAFDELARGSPDPILLVRDGAVRFANDAMVRMLGLASPRHLLKRPLSHLVHADDLEVFEETPTLPRHTVRFRREDLSLATAEVAIAPVVFAGESVRLVMARDVSDERALRARMMSLDRQIAVGTLAAGVAHEVNNPLSVVQSNLEHLRQGLGVPAFAALASSEPFDDWPELLGEARDGAERIRSIVQDLHDAVHNEQDDPMEPQYLAEVLPAVLRLTRARLEEKARVEIDLRSVPPVMAAPGRLAQVFINLLTNAADALPPGRADEHRIRVQSFEHDGEAVVIVEDDGEGIEPHLRSRIFDPFFTTRSAGDGTGLGLFICQRIVSGCGGSIELRSEVGEGTRFVVRLPGLPD